MGKKNIPYIEETYDVVVVGAGHAGCEAALACARLNDVYGKCGQYCINAM